MTDKILILGANAETIGLVETAKAMGLRTVVADPSPKSPAKRNSDIAYDVDVTNLDEVGKIIAKEDISGILVGVADSLVPYYERICAAYGFPCYASEAAVAALCSKQNFSRFLEKNGLDAIPGHTVEEAQRFAREGLPHPIVIKPSDRGAGVGMSVCTSTDQIVPAIDTAMACSLRKQIIVERFMECDDMFAYYTIMNGVPYLSATADRIKTRTQATLSQVCLAARYPSKHTRRYLVEMDAAIVNCLRKLDIRCGVLLIQFFVDDTKFYAYDPGFRLQGEAPHLYLKHIFGFDQQEMLLAFALGRRTPMARPLSSGDVLFNSLEATTFWILLKAGTIVAIEGFETVSRLPEVIHVVRRLDVGDVVADSWLGTERQTLARIYTTSPIGSDHTRLARSITDALSVKAVGGEDMILDIYCPEKTT